MNTPRVRIEPAGEEDAGEILTVQRAAYLAEAQLYGDPFLPPLVETIEQLRRALTGSDTLVLKAIWGSRLVGAVRGTFGERTCLVGRLAVAPDVQGRGIGTGLLRALEERAAARADSCALFTGHLSDGGLRLCRRLGYTETHRERLAAHLTVAHLRKPLVSEDP